MPAEPFLVVAGNIGVGKTALVKLLSELFGWRPVYEPDPNGNPYLADFYEDMGRWAFKSQVWFLSQRSMLVREIAKLEDEGAIQDRGLYEDGEIFVRNLRGVMTELEYQLYQMLYEALVSILPAPNLVIYLQASVPTLVRRIEHRGRGYEDEIPRRYLAQLNRNYKDWAERFGRCSVLTIPTDELDFVRNPDHLDLIAKSIADSLRLNQTPTVVHRATNPSDRME